MASNLGEWRRIERVLDRVLDLSGEELERVLDQECRGDSALRGRIEALLRSDTDGSFLARSAFDVLGPPTESDSSGPDPDVRDLAIGGRVGPWHLRERIGAGGMGTVYLAERDEGTFRQRAALKAISRLRASEDLTRRFLRERQILARLEHPNITRLIDGGVTDDGIPWLVMEHVEGEPISDWCRARDATLETRLDLIEAVAEAVQFAHQRLVVHRDLKPSNVLVDTAGRPKLLDFGVARLLDDTEDGTLTSGAGAFTPRYAAPEQLLGDVASTRTDVYSLGLLLFEILTDRPPFPLEGPGLADVWRRVLESGPGRPSDVPCRYRSRLRGDLDAIVARATDRDPAHRYASADAFLADLRAYRNAEPVAAMRGRRWYALRKFAARHRVAAISAGVVAIAILGGLAATTRQASVARQERARAEREAGRAVAVSDFLVRLFTEADPEVARPDRPVSDFLEEGVARLNAEGESLGPEAYESLLDVVARIQFHQGAYASSRDLAERLVDVRVARQGASSPDAEEARILWARAEMLIADDRTAADSLESLLGRIAPYGRDHPTAIRAKWALAEAYAGLQEHATCDSLLAEIAALDSLPPDVPRSEVLLRRGIVLRIGRRFAEAADVTRAAIAAREQEVGPDHWSVAAARAELASILLRDGKSEEAADLYESAIPRLLDHFPPEHANFAAWWQDFALARKNQGHLIAAESLSVKALDVSTRVFGADTRNVAPRRSALGLVYMLEEKYEDAEREFRRALDISEATLGPDNPNTVIAGHNWSCALREIGDYARADSVGRAVQAARVRASGERSTDFAYSGLHQGILYTRMGRFPEAERLLAIARTVFAEAWGEEHPKVAETEAALAELRVLVGRAEDALARVDVAIPRLADAYSANHPRTLDARVTRGRALASLARSESAIAELEAVLATDGGHPTRRARAEAQGTLALLRAERGEREAARAHRDAALALWDSMPRAVDPLTARVRALRI
ncbi:MAG: serine/threonine-protein kinase [bacterium]